MQVRNVEILVNGKVVANDVAYPWSYDFTVPSIASGGSTITVQARAWDTGGNSTLSTLATYTVTPDTIPPTIVATSVTQNASVFYVKTITIDFSKPIDTTKLNLSGITLINAGPDGMIGTADDTTVPVTFSTRALGQVMTLTLANPLPAGTFQLTISPSIVFDIHGNQLASPYVLNFTVRPASNVKATSGVPAITQEPSANPGQLIGISVPFDPSTAHMVFDVINSSGTQSTVDVATSEFDEASSTAYFQVPYAAETGNVTVYSLVGSTKTNFADGQFPLEIVPVVNSITVNSVSSDGTSANVTLHGLGFIEANNSQYNFGTTTVTDTDPSSGPDVYSSSLANDTVNLTVPLSAGAFGPITVTTAGGTSLPLTLALSGITGTALSGTPANASIASANPGQAVTLTGSGLSTSTGIIASYTNSGGTVSTVLLSPATAALNGTSATLIVPNYFNGVTTLSVLGSSSAPTLQIVPVLSGYSVDGTDTLRLYGLGLQEGSAANTVTYNFAGGSISDTSGSGGPDVYNNSPDNSAVYLPAEPVHGFGPVTTTTAGGTSAPLTLNEFQTGDGYIRDIAAVPGQPNELWVADNGNPAKLHLIDTTTGQDISSITITNGSGGTPNFGGTTFYGGIQVVPTSFTLGTTSVPAGSLLLFYGPPNPDVVIAVNPASGQIIATMTLPGNYDTTAGVYDPVTGDLFVLNRNASPNQITAIFASGPNAGTVDAAHTFAAPFNAGEAGLALDPSGNGTLWYGSDQSGNVVQLSNTGTVLHTVSVGLQLPGNISVSGLAFDSAGNLLIGTTQGVVGRINVNYQPAMTTPTLTGITALATDGTPANAAVASADANQVITLTGTNFNPGTEVVFEVRDQTGAVTQQAVAPLMINTAGTVLQVQVPAQATTGALQVVNVGYQNLGFGSWPDALYRGMTVQFTASASTSAITFADGGLEGVGNESWGLDNVSVAQGNTTIFSDNFESGSANPARSQNVVDTSLPGVFTDFLGRFSSGNDTLTLTGLTAGQTYTLKFDLYAIDSLDGETTTYGPDELLVSDDGKQLLNLAMSNYTSEVQNFNGSATLPLQIVPTLTSMDGSAGGDGNFDLFGSGLQAGATSITVGGVTLADTQFTNEQLPGP